MQFVNNPQWRFSTINYPENNKKIMVKWKKGQKMLYKVSSLNQEDKNSRESLCPSMLSDLNSLGGNPRTLQHTWSNECQSHKAKHENNNRKIKMLKIRTSLIVAKSIYFAPSIKAWPEPYVWKTTVTANFWKSVVQFSLHYCVTRIFFRFGCLPFILSALFHQSM